VRIGKFGVQNQPKPGVVLDLAVAEPDGATFLDGVAADDRVEHRVDRLVDVLEQDRVAGDDGPLDHVEVVLLAESDDAQLRVAAAGAAAAVRHRRVPRLPTSPTTKLKFHGSSFLACTLPFFLLPFCACACVYNLL